MVRLVSKRGFLKGRLLVDLPSQKSLLLLAAPRRCQLTLLKDANHVVRLGGALVVGQGESARLSALTKNQDNAGLATGDENLAGVNQSRIFFTNAKDEERAKC
jgi:hypothetical protein